MSLSTFNFSIPQGTQEQDCTSGNAIGGLDSNNIFRLLQVTSNGLLPNSTTNAATALGATPQPLNPSAYAANVCLCYFTNLYSNTSGRALQIDFSPNLLAEFSAGNLINLVFMYSASNLANYSITRSLGVDTFAPSIADVSGALSFFHNQPFQPFGAPGAGSLVSTAASPIIGRSLVLPSGTNLQCMVIAGGAITNNGNQVYLGFNKFSIQ
jgi:hypothetical protein